MQFSRDEHVIWVTCVAVIAAFSFLLYRDLTRSRGGGSGEIVGWITYKYNSAQRKYDNEVVWESLPNTTGQTRRVPVYNRDAIRTADLAEATIELKKDGTQIKLDANSMIIIDVSDKSASINYAYGSIRAAAGSDASGINIKTKDNKTIAIKNSDVKIATTAGQDVNVTVSRGEARIAVDGREQTIGKNQVAVVGREIRVRPLNLRPTAPEDGRRFFATGGEEAVSFAWTRAGGSGRVDLQIARDPAFREIVRSAGTNANSMTMRLPPGVFYWRLSARNPDSGATELSTALRLSVSRKESLSFAVPAQEARIDYVKDEPLVAFAWNRAEFASGYVLEIARDPDFRDSLRRLDSNSNTIATRLAEGTYYCRVTSRSSFEDAQSTSPTRVIRIVKRERLPPPTPVQPEANRSISRVLLEKQGMLFNWRGSAQLAGAELQIVGPGTNRTRNVSGSVFALREALPLGEYTWKVRGLDAQGQPITDFSAAAPFRVVADQKLRLLAPAAGEVVDYLSARFPGVSLSWERASFAAHYRFRISRNRDLSQPVQNRETDTPYASVGALPPGVYYWSVELIADKAVLSASETGSFQVSDLLPDPEPVFPAGGATVDMTLRNTLALRWQALRGADAYVVSLYQITDGGRRRVAQARLQDTEYLLQDLSLLDKGRFVWTLQAVRTVDGRAVRSRELSREFVITLDEKTVPKVDPAEVYIK